MCLTNVLFLFLLTRVFFVNLQLGILQLPSDMRPGLNPSPWWLGEGGAKFLAPMLKKLIMVNTVVWCGWLWGNEARMVISTISLSWTSYSIHTSCSSWSSSLLSLTSVSTSSSSSILCPILSSQRSSPSPKLRFCWCRWGSNDFVGLGKSGEVHRGASGGLCNRQCFEGRREEHLGTRIIKME